MGTAAQSRKRRGTPSEPSSSPPDWRRSWTRPATSSSSRTSSPKSRRPCRPPPPSVNNEQHSHCTIISKTLFQYSITFFFYSNFSRLELFCVVNSFSLRATGTDFAVIILPFSKNETTTVFDTSLNSLTFRNGLTKHDDKRPT